MNNTLANGLALLDFLSHTAETFGVSELATKLTLPKSHVHRLLQTLVTAGYAVQEADRRYRIGLRPLEVSCALLHNLPLRAAALPSLHRLAKSTRLDAFVAIPHQGGGLVVGAVYTDGLQRDPAASIGMMLKGGTATCALFSACISGFAKPTCTASEATKIRRARFAVKDPEFSGPMNGMAALVSDSTGTTLGALCLSGPTEEFSENFDQKSTLLRTLADELGARFAHQATAKGTP